MSSISSDRAVQDQSDRVRQLRDAATGSRLMAEAARVVAEHFRPQYEACWERTEDGKMGRLMDQDMVMRLYPYTMDKEREAKEWAKDAAMLDAAADFIARAEAASVTVETTEARYGAPPQDSGATS